MQYIRMYSRCRKLAELSCYIYLNILKVQHLVLELKVWKLLVSQKNGDRRRNICVPSRPSCEEGSCIHLLHIRADM